MKRWDQWGGEEKNVWINRQWKKERIKRKHLIVLIYNNFKVKAYKINKKNSLVSMKQVVKNRTQNEKLKTKSEKSELFVIQHSHCFRWVCWIIETHTQHSTHMKWGEEHHWGGRSRCSRGRPVAGAHSAQHWWCWRSRLPLWSPRGVMYLHW